MNLTTIAALPMGAGCLSRLEPEVGKSPERPKMNSAELLAAINAIVEMNMGAISNSYRLALLYGGEAIPPVWRHAPAQNLNALANLGYQVNAQGQIERL